MKTNWIATLLLIALLVGLAACKPRATGGDNTATVRGAPEPQPVTEAASSIEKDINTLEVSDETSSLDTLDSDLADLDMMFG